MNVAQNLNFQAINRAALAHPSYLESRLPDSRREGRELVAADIKGGLGSSFKFNLDSGKWADFSGDEKGGDAVSLVAAQEGIGQGEAARLIADELGLSSPAPLARKELPKCPINPNNLNKNLTGHYCYKDSDGSELF